MLYHVSRNGQMYGPYTLDDLRRYVASGNVLPTDLAKSEEMAEWLPVAQVLGMPAAPFAAPAAYAQTEPSAYPMAEASAYPDPPNLPWALVLVFNIFTCGLFMVVWNIVVSAWMRRVQPASLAMLYYIVGAALSLSSSGAFFALRYHHTFSRHPPLAGFVALAAWVIRLVARFTLKADLERHFNGPDPIGLRLSGVMVFFFGGLYFQYHLNRIMEIKNALGFRGAMR